MARDYTIWPAQADVQARLTSVGAAPRLIGSALTQRIQDATDEVLEQVAQTTNRQFVADPVPTTRVFDGTGTAEIEIDEFVTLVSVFIIGISAAPGFALTNTVAITEQGKPQTRVIVGQGSVPAYTTAGVVVPYPSIFPLGRQNISVNANFGYGPTIPMTLWQAVCGEIATKLLAETIFTPSGRISSTQFGDEKTGYRLDGADSAGWHSAYLKALKDYKRPDGRRLRNMRPRMT